MSAAIKYETRIHITPEYLDKFPILNANKQNDFARSNILKGFGGCKAVISQNYCDAGRFL